MESSTDQISLGPATASHRLVLLHGWGADASDLLDLGELLVAPDVSIVALQGSEPHPAGSGRQWYDLQQPEWPGLPGARQQLLQRLDRLDAELPLSRTVLLGFSQGAALGLDVATSAALPLAGLIGCSGYPHPDWHPQPPAGLCDAIDQPTRILLTHGQQDPVVPYEASEELERQLRQAGHRVELVGFSGGHTIDSTVLPVLQRFLMEALSS